MTEQSSESFLPPSKRAARRILQRAIVLTGRDRHLRQHLRAVRLTTLWILEDWDLVWTVILDRGKIEFERRPARHPDLTFSWKTGGEFFSSASHSIRAKGGTTPGSVQRAAALFTSDERARARIDSTARGEGTMPGGPLDSVGDPDVRRVASHLLNCFFGYLGHVLRNPVDGAGESLL